MSTRKRKPGYGFRGQVIAQVLGPPCLCTERIVKGDPIVKRWNQWIHAACYAEILSARPHVGREERL